MAQTPEEARSAEIIRLQLDIQAGKDLLAAGEDSGLQAEIEGFEGQLSALLAAAAAPEAAAAPDQQPTARRSVGAAWGLTEELGLG